MNAQTILLTLDMDVNLLIETNLNFAFSLHPERKL